MGKKKCMTCKQWIAGEEISAIIGKKDMHFCSEKCKDIAVKEQLEKEKKAADKDRAYRLVCEILGVPEVINTALWKEWEQWYKVADDDKIGKYLAENKAELTRLIARLDSAIYPRIRYLSAVLKNKLGDYKPKAEEIEKPHVVSIDEGYETKYKVKTQRVSFDDMEDEI